MSRRVLVLAVLVLAVGGWLIFRELPFLESERDRAIAELRVFEDVPFMIDSLRIRQHDREILVVNEDDRWFLRTPIDEEIPPLGAVDLIERLANTEQWRRVGTGLKAEEWDVYGLGEDSPGRVRIELIGEGRVSSVDVGNLTPGSRSVWVRRAGSDDLEVVLSDLYDVANMTHQGLRDPRLFKITHGDLTLMSFAAGGNEWSAVRGRDGLWFLGSADGPRLKRWILEDVAFSVAGQRVDGYLRDFLEADDWTAYGLDQPWGTVEWEATEGRSGALWLGNELGGGIVFGRRAGLETVFQLAPGLDNSFDADTSELIDHNPIDANFMHSVKIHVTDGDGFVDVIRETPGARAESESGPIEGGDYVQVASRNLQLGLEEFQPLAEMFVPSGRDAADLLDVVEASMTIHWPDHTVDLQIGRMAGDVWIAYDGSLYQTTADMLLRVREVLKLRG